MLDKMEMLAAHLERASLAPARGGRSGRSGA
jgi:hypothetical protein